MKSALLLSLLFLAPVQQPCATVAECSAAIDALRRETRLESDLRATALAEARRGIDVRLAEMNEVRAQINQERGSFVSVDKYEADHERTIGRLDAIDKRSAYLAGGFVVLQALFGFAFALYLKKSPIRAPSRDTDLGRPEVKH